MTSPVASPSAASASLGGFTLFDTSLCTDGDVGCSLDSLWYPHYVAGTNALEQGKYAAAAEGFTKALTSGYRKPCKIVKEEQLTFTAIMLERRAFALLKMGQLVDALSDIKIAIRTVPSTMGGDMPILQADIHLSAKSYDLALQAYQRGLSLLDPTAATISQDVQTDNITKLEHLVRTQVIDSGKPLDPFAHLPTELVELFLQIGMEQDEHFALRCTWVCRDWRRTVQAIPSLWRTYSHKSWKRKSSAERQAAWIRNSAERLTGLRLVHVDQRSDMVGIAAGFASQFSTIETLYLEGTTVYYQNIVDVLAQSLPIVPSLKAIHINTSTPRSAKQLDLGLLTEGNRGKIQELHLECISFNFHKERNGDDGSDGSENHQYAGLRTLNIQGCVFHFGKESKIATGATTAVSKPQYDPLHRLLRHSPNLEELRLHCGLYLWAGGQSPASYDRELVHLDNLRTLRIPPPHMWTIDVATPNLRHLAVDLMEKSRDPAFGLEKSTDCQQGLLLTPESLRLTRIDIGRLVSVELMINGRDTENDMAYWLRGMGSVERLVIKSSPLSLKEPLQVPVILPELPAPASSSSDSSGDTFLPDAHSYSFQTSRLAEGPKPTNLAHTANRSIVSMLQQEPGFCPKLRILRLTNIYTPEAPLISWIQARQKDPSVATVASLTLSHCTSISSAAKQQLRNEVAEFISIEHEHITRLDWKELCDHWDIDVAKHK